MAPLNVLVSGAGIAGNALAFWLSRLGHNVTVIERFNTLRVTGLQLDLRGHGIEVLKRMGLEEAFRARAAPENGLRIVDTYGTQHAFFGQNKSGKGLQGFTTDYEIMRGDLCRLFYDNTLKTRTKYMFDKSIKSFDEKDNLVNVQFADGTQGQYDLVVGADGQGSRTRKLMLGDRAAEGVCPLDGVYISYFSIPRPIEEGEQYAATAYASTNGRFIMTRRKDPDMLQVYLTIKTDSERLRNVTRGDVAEEKAALTELFQGAGWLTPEILEALKESEDFYCERLELIKLDAWSRGRVTLLGDAAYCPTATTGMGTTSAVVGAYMLAGEIATHCDPNAAAAASAADGVPAALRAYEDKFRPFIDRVQRGIDKDGGLWGNMPSSPFAIAVMNRLLGVAAFLRLNLLGKWILREDVRGWDLPAYEDMGKTISANEKKKP